MVKSWQCQGAAYVAGFGVVRPGTILEFESGSEPAYVKANFKCLTPSQVKEEKEKQVEDNDLTFAAKVEKLKDMKVKMPRGMKKAEVEQLFDEYVNKVELPEIV